MRVCCQPFFKKGGVGRERERGEERALHIGSQVPAPSRNRAATWRCWIERKSCPGVVTLHLGARQRLAPILPGSELPLCLSRRGAPVLASRRTHAFHPSRVKRGGKKNLPVLTNLSFPPPEREPAFPRPPPSPDFPIRLSVWAWLSSPPLHSPRLSGLEVGFPSCARLNAATGLPCRRRQMS